MIKIIGIIFLFIYPVFAQNITQITTNNTNQNSPDIYKDKIVYQDYRNQNFDIYLYDTSTGEETQITTDTDYQGNPIIYRDTIVYESNEKNKYALYMYDLVTKEKTLITSKMVNGYSLYENHLVWAEDSAIYLFDTDQKTITQIIPKSSQNWNENPSVYKNKVVWDDGNSLYLYDLSTETTLKIASANQAHPDIWEDKIVWQNCTETGCNIFLYDIQTKKTTQITNDSFDERNPKIYGNKIVWYSNKNGNWDIFLYDIQTKKTVQVTTNKADQTFAKIYDGKIVWVDERAGINNEDIYMSSVESSGNDYLRYTSPYMNTSSTYRTYIKVFNINSCSVNIKALVYDSKGNYVNSPFDLYKDLKQNHSTVIYAKDIRSKASLEGTNLLESFGITLLYSCADKPLDPNKIFTQIVQKSPSGQRVMPVYKNDESIKGEGKIIIPHIYKDSSAKHSSYRAFIQFLNISSKVVTATIKAYSKSANLYTTTYTLPANATTLIKTRTLYPDLGAPYGTILSLVIEIDNNIEDIYPVMVQKTPDGPRVLETFKIK